MKGSRQTELVRDRDRGRRVDDHQAHRRITRFRGQQLHAPGVFIAFPGRKKRTAGSSVAAGAAGSSTSASAAIRSRALTRATGRGNPVDVESDLARQLAQRPVQRPGAGERRSILRVRRSGEQHKCGSRHHETHKRVGPLHISSIHVSYFLTSSKYLLFSLQIYSSSSVSGSSTSGSVIVHGFVYAFGSSIVI